MKYKAIGFDYGGVLYGPSGVVFDNAVANLINVSVEEYRQTYFRHNTKFASSELIWKHVLNDLDQEQCFEDLLQFIARFNNEKKINSDMIELASDLRSRGYKVGLLSNNSREKADAMRLQKINTYFDAFCVSAEIGYSKPEKQAFEYLTGQLGVALNELIFIDDEPTSLKNSRRDGYAAIRFIGYDQLIKDLISFGILN